MLMLQHLRQFTPSHPHTYRAFHTSVIWRERIRPFKLPSAKLRALITLYHRSSSFVTPANLSRRIDRAFTESSRNNSSGIFYTEYQGLEARVQRNRETSGPPTLAYRSVPLNEFSTTTWSAMRSERQDLVNSALWGIHFGGKPSLEIVWETHATDIELGNLLDQTGDARKL